MTPDAPITFLASFPNIQTAIRVAGDGGARILLDIPEDELPAIARLLLMRGQLLTVTIEPAQSLQNKSKQNATQRTHQQSQWTTREKPGHDRDP